MKTKLLLNIALAIVLNSQAFSVFASSYYQNPTDQDLTVIGNYSGFQMRRNTVKETCVHGEMIFQRSTAECLNCGLGLYYLDSTALSPKRSLFEHRNITHRFFAATENSVYGNSRILDRLWQLGFQFSVNDQSSPLLPPAQELVSSPQLFYEYCGNRYIETRTIGGYLAIAYKIEFANSEEEQFFNANVVNTYNLVDLVPEFVDKLQNSGLDGAMSVLIHTIGGSWTHLYDYLGPNAEDRTASLVCPFSDLSPCHNLFKKYRSYWGGSEDGYSSQFNGLNTGDPSITQVIDYGLQDYLVALGPNYLEPYPTDSADISQAQQGLLSAYDTNLQSLNRAQLLLNIFNHRIDDDRYGALSAVVTDTEYNLQIIGELGIQCLDYASSCAIDYQQMQIREIDETLLYLEPLTEEELNSRLNKTGDGNSDPTEENNGESGGAIDNLSLLFYLVLMLLNLRNPVHIPTGLRGLYN